jgi:hypothetical protein
MGSAYGVEIHPELLADGHALLAVLLHAIYFLPCLHPYELRRQTPLNLRHLFPAKYQSHET